MSVAMGWLARAEHLLESQPESRVHAALLAYRAFGELIATHLTEAIALADQAMEVARRQGSADALFAAMAFKGMAEVASGNWRAGLPLIDEAATPPRPASLISSSQARSSATRWRRAGTSETSSVPGSGPMRPSDGCADSRWVDIRACAGFIAQS